MTIVNQMISQIPIKVELSPGDCAALFACGFVSCAILSNVFKKIKNVQLERQVRNLEALRREDEERFEQEMEQEAECFRIIRRNDLNKISLLESQRAQLIASYQDLEEQNCELISQLNALEASEEEHEDMSEITEETLTEEDDEDVIEDEPVQNVPFTRRLWTNKEKGGGSYQDKLPDGFKAFIKSVKCKKTMHLTFHKGGCKEENRWIIDETGNEYKSLNQARNAFFGDELKTKQSVWLSTKSSEDGRNLREVIEGRSY